MFVDVVVAHVPKTIPARLDVAGAVSTPVIGPAAVRACLETRLHLCLFFLGDTALLAIVGGACLDAHVANIDGRRVVFACDRDFLDETRIAVTAPREVDGTHAAILLRCPARRKHGTTLAQSHGQAFSSTDDAVSPFVPPSGGPGFGASK